MPSTTTVDSIKPLQLITPRPLPTRAQPFSTAIVCVQDKLTFAYPHQKSIYLVDMSNPHNHQEIRHTATVTSVCFSPKNSFLLAGDVNGRLRSWSLPGLEPLKEWQVLADAIRCIRFQDAAVDEELFFVSGEGREYFAAAIHGDKVMPLSGPTKSCASLYASSSLLLLASQDFTCTAFDLSAPFPRQGPKFLGTLKGVHSNAVLGVCGNREHFFSAGADGFLVKYSTATHEVIKSKKCHNGAILGAVLHESGLLTVSTDGCLSLWHPETLEAISQHLTSLSMPDGQACSVALAGDVVIVTRLNGAVERYTLPGLERGGELSFGHAKGITKIWSENDDDECIWSESYDGEILAWKLSNDNNELKQCNQKQNSTNPSTQSTSTNIQSTSPSLPANAHVIAKGSTCTAWSDPQHSIHLSSKKVFWCHHSARVDALCWLPSGVLVSGGVDGNLMAWREEREREPVASVKGAHAGPITGIVAVGRDGRFVSIGQDSTLRYWMMQ